MLFTSNVWCSLRLVQLIGGSTKTVKHSIKNISKNIGAVFFKLGTRSLHHKRNRMTPTMLLPWQHSRLQSPSVKNQISQFVIFYSVNELNQGHPTFFCQSQDELRTKESEFVHFGPLTNEGLAVKKLFISINENLTTNFIHC